MRKVFFALVSGGLFGFCGVTLADSHEGGEMDPATPVEMYACNLNEGKTRADWDAAAAEWNQWADEQDETDYSAWTLAPFYMSANQDFDVVWLGGSGSGAAMGRAQDEWLAKGSKVAETFAATATCHTHAAYAVLQFKKPPKRDNPSNIAVSFSDCNLADGVSFGDIAGGLGEWATYREGHGSTAGIWVFFPAYGGGGEEFDFKFVTAHQNMEDVGKDFDEYSKTGWQKAGELFEGKVSCDSARVYMASNIRMAESDDE